MDDDTLRTFLRVHSRYKHAATDTLLYTRGVSLHYIDDERECEKRMGVWGSIRSALKTVYDNYIRERAFRLTLFLLKPLMTKAKRQLDDEDYFNMTMPLFRVYCQEGNLSGLVRWIEFTRVSLRKLKWSEVFPIACESGHLHVVVWLLRLLVDDDSSPAYASIDFLLNGLTEACVHGQLHVAKLLVRKFPFLKAPSHLYEVFCLTCDSEHPHVARWLYELGDRNNNPILGPYLAREDNMVETVLHTNTLLKSINHEGNIETFLWARATFSERSEHPTLLDIDNYDAFTAACQENHLHIASWIIQHHTTEFLSRVPENRSGDIFTVLCVAARSAATVSWALQLLRERNLEPTDDIKRLFFRVCSRGRLHIAMLLYEEFPELRDPDVLREAIVDTSDDMADVSFFFTFRPLACDHVNTWLESKLP